MLPLPLPALPRSSPVLLTRLPPGVGGLDRFVGRVGGCFAAFFFVCFSFNPPSFSFSIPPLFFALRPFFLGAFVPSPRPGSARVRHELQRHRRPDEYSSGFRGVQEMALQLVVRQVSDERGGREKEFLPLTRSVGVGDRFGEENKSRRTLPTYIHTLHTHEDKDGGRQDLIICLFRAG